MTHVILFGDSVSYGLFDELGGWVRRIRTQIDSRNIAEKGYWTLMYNLGVSGDTAPDILKRIDTELPARKESDDKHDNFVLFAVGVNDSAFLVNEGRPRFSEEEFRLNLHSLAKIASNYAHRIAFVGLFLVDQPAVDPIPWAPTMAYRNSIIRDFDRVIRAICRTGGFDYLNLMDLWNEDEAKRYLQDGVHPNSDGHRLIAEKVSGFFRKYALL